MGLDKTLTMKSLASSYFSVCKQVFPFVLQMLFLATFFPTWEGGAGVYDFVGVSVDWSDLS